MQYNLLLVGVGGQGIVTLSEIIAMSAVSRGIKAIVTQDRGLAQRGGTVKAHVRLGDVFSPLIPKGTVHALLSLEAIETLGFLNYINKDSILIINEKRIIPRNLLLKKGRGTTIEEIKQLLKPLKNVYFINAESRIREIGLSMGTNILMLGLLLGLDDRIKPFIGKSDIISVMEKRLRRYIEENVKALNEGIRLGERLRRTASY